MARYTLFPGAGQSVSVPESGGTLTNLSSQTIYYSGQANVSASDTAVAAGASATVYGTTWVFATARADINVVALTSTPVTAATRNRLSSVYIPSDECLLNFRKAVTRARNGGAPARVEVRGDSTTYGVISGTNPTAIARRDLIWYARARQLLNSGNMLPGLVEESIMQLAAADDSRMVYAGGSAGVLTAGQTLTFTEVAGGHDRFDVVVLRQGSAASITANPDAAGAQTLTLSQANNTVQRFTVTATGTGAHSIVFTGPATGTATIYVIEPWSSAAPPVMWLGGYGVSGQTLAGLNPGSTGVGQNMFGPLNVKPDLQILLMGINDMRAATDFTAAAATYKTNAGSFTTAFQAQNTDVAYMMFPSYNSNQSGFPSATESVPFHQALYELADERNCAALDLQRRWGYGVTPTTGFATTPVSSTAMYDGTHWTLLGDWDGGRMLARFLADATA